MGAANSCIYLVSDDTFASQAEGKVTWELPNLYLAFDCTFALHAVVKVTWELPNHVYI